MRRTSTAAREQKDRRAGSAGRDPLDRSCPNERLAEVAEILAAGLMRLLAPKSSEKSANFGESSLALPEHQSGHALVPSPEDEP